MSRADGKVGQRRGGQPPHPRDLPLCGRNGSAYTGCARAEDKATQGCDLSAASSAETTGRLRPPQNPTDKFRYKFPYRFLYKFKGHFGLDNGVHPTSAPTNFPTDTIVGISISSISISTCRRAATTGPHPCSPRRSGRETNKSTCWSPACPPSTHSPRAAPPKSP